MKQEMGAVRREIEHHEGRPDRDIYHLTEQGDEVLLAFLRDFPPDVAKRDAEFWVRAAYLDLLESPERLAILTTRRASTAQLHAHMERMQDAEQLLASTRRVLICRARQFQAELDWLDELLQE